MGHWSIFRHVMVGGRPFEMYGSPVDLSKCIGHRSTFRNAWVTGRLFGMYGSSVAPPGKYGTWQKMWLPLMFVDLVVLYPTPKPLAVVLHSMGHRSTFRNVWFTSRPFENVWILFTASKRVCHRSTYRNVRVSGRPFETYGSSVAPPKHMACGRKCCCDYFRYTLDDKLGSVSS